MLFSDSCYHAIPLFVFAFPPVVTFSRADAARAMEIGCGVASAPDVPVHVHRNIPGNLVYCVAEDHREAVLYSESQQCHELSKEVLDMWRDESGEVKAMLIQKTEGRLLMVGEAELRGKRFDVERTGQYFVISQGDFSQLSAIAKPYRVLLTLDFDAQRIFTRKNELLVVGNNFKTNQLEARVVRYSEGSLVQLPPMPIANMPAGVRVLDYSEKTDDLLLGGVDPSGQTMFVVVNLSSGSASAVTLKSPEMIRRCFSVMGIFVQKSVVLRVQRLASDLPASGKRQVRASNDFSRFCREQAKQRAC